MHDSKRCDAARPKCGKCSYREVQCLYDEQSRKAEELAEEVVVLERRLLDLQNNRSGPQITLADHSWTPDGWWETDEPPLPLRRFL